MITVSYTGAVFILCLLKIADMAVSVFLYFKLQKSVLNTKEQNMVDIRSLVPMLKEPSREFEVIRQALLKIKDDVQDIRSGKLISFNPEP